MNKGIKVIKKTEIVYVNIPLISFAKCSFVNFQKKKVNTGDPNHNAKSTILPILIFEKSNGLAVICFCIDCKNIVSPMITVVGKTHVNISDKNLLNSLLNFCLLKVRRIGSVLYLLKNMLFSVNFNF